MMDMFDLKDHDKIVISKKELERLKRSKNMLEMLLKKAEKDKAELDKKIGNVFDTIETYLDLKIIEFKKDLNVAKNKDLIVVKFERAMRHLKEMIIEEEKEYFKKYTAKYGNYEGDN